MISSRTLTDGRVSRFWILWEKFWEYQDIPSGELIDESCNGDFIDDGDLYTISGNKAKLICENVEYVWCYDLIIDDYESSADSDGEEAADSDAEAEAEPEESEEYAESDGYRAVPQLPSSIYRDTIAPSSL